MNTPVVSPTFTSTQTNTVLVPTWTSTVTITVTYTQTKQPTVGNAVTYTQTVILVATATSTITAVVENDTLTIPNNPIAYPNPNSGQQLNIKFDISRNVTAITVKIYTQSHRLIRKTRVDENLQAGKCDVSVGREYLIGLAKGAYLYQVTVNDNEGRTAKSTIEAVIIQ